MKARRRLKAPCLREHIILLRLLHALRKKKRGVGLC